jgi:hypothetical protein
MSRAVFAITHPFFRHLVANLFENWDLTSAMFVHGADELDDNLVLAARSLPQIDFMPPLGVNVYDLLRHHQVVVSSQGLAELEQRLTKADWRTAKRIRHVVELPPPVLPAKSDLWVTKIQKRTRMVALFPARSLSLFLPSICANAISGPSTTTSTWTTSMLQRPRAKSSSNNMRRVRCA